MATTAAPIILVPGFWLGAWAWDDVADKLRADGHDVTAITLPGLESKDDDRSDIDLSDHVDAFWPDQLGTFDGKPLRSITKGGLDLSKFALEGEQPQAPEGIDAFVAALKTALGAEVSDVRTTDRLVDSAVVLSAGSGGPDLQMQRLMRRAGRAGAGQPVLEINPRHPLIRALAAAPESEVPQAAGTLLDLARIQDGDSPRDPAAFARTVAAALAAARGA